MHVQPCSDLQAFSWKNYEQSCLNVNIKNYSQYPVLVIHKNGTRNHMLTPYLTRATPKRQILEMYLVKYQIPLWCLLNESKNSTLLRCSDPFKSLNVIPWL